MKILLLDKKETLTRAHVEEACVAASANHFVENLQEQYDTVIGRTWCWDYQVGQKAKN